MVVGKPSGILWAGVPFDRGGYGNVNRNYLRALLAANIPFRVFNFGEIHEDVDASTLGLITRDGHVSLGRFPICVVNFPPDLMPLLRIRGVAATVSASIFETHSLPPPWVTLSNRTTQVWVPSRFNQETYAQAGVLPEKLRIIPYPLDCDYFAEGHPRQRIPGAKGFVFLYVFAFGWRKGFDVLLQAYLQEFRARDDVTLVLKVYPGNPQVADLTAAILDSVRPALDPTAPGSPHVLIMTEPIPQSALRSLYAACDLYISTDRANGWGMPCMEAMAMGKATATIDWSGSTEFMTAENCFLILPGEALEPVDPRLVQANPSVYAGQMWPKVPIQEVRRVLRLAYEDRALLQAKGQRAAADIRARFTFARVGERFREVLATFPELDAPARTKPTINFGWPTRLRRLGGKIHSALLPYYKP